MADIYTISSTTTNTLNPIRDKALYTLVDGAGSSTIVNKLTSALTSSMSSQTASTMNLIPVINDGKMQGMDISTFKNILYPEPEPEWVEIAGLKWGTKNVGANKVTDTGLYFAWGDTQGYTASQVGSGSGQKYFGWADYKWGDGSSSPSWNSMTKYNLTDGLTTLVTSDDAATVNLGSGWRMPTSTEWKTLGLYTTQTWTNDYKGSGVRGLILTSNADSSKVLFFPAAGSCNQGSAFIGTCNYWSSSLYTPSNLSAFFMLDSGGNPTWDSFTNRNVGNPIRGVMAS